MGTQMRATRPIIIIALELDFSSVTSYNDIDEYNVVPTSIQIRH